MVSVYSEADRVSHTQQVFFLALFGVTLCLGCGKGAKVRHELSPSTTVEFEPETREAYISACNDVVAVASGRKVVAFDPRDLSLIAEVTWGDEIRSVTAVSRTKIYLGTNYSISVWNPARSAGVKELFESQVPIRQVVVDHHEDRLFYSTRSKVFALTSLRSSPELLHSLPSRTEITCFAWNSVTRRLAIGTYGGVVFGRDKDWRTLAPGQPISTLTFSPRGTRLAYVADNTFTIVDTSSAAILAEVPSFFASSTLEFAPSEARVLFLTLPYGPDKPSELEEFDLATGRRQTIGRSPHRSLSATPSGDLFSAGNATTVAKWIVHK